MLTYIWSHCPLCTIKGKLLLISIIYLFIYLFYFEKLQADNNSLEMLSTEVSGVHDVCVCSANMRLSITANIILKSEVLMHSCAIIAKQNVH